MSNLDYTIEEITGGNLAKIVFPDGSWTFVQLSANMEESSFEAAVAMAYPPHLKDGSGVPDFATAAIGQTRQSYIEELPDPEPTPEWLLNRMDGYGNINAQIEYITEHGLEAWQQHVAEIKAANPKPSE